MKLLPSEQRRATKEAVELFKEQGSILLEEPCDCGINIRHHNSGNYHEIVTICKDEGRTFARFSDTCELTPTPEWEEITEEEAIEIIKDRSKSGYIYK